MEYVGKLFGQMGRKYIDTGKTSEDWDKMESDLKKRTKALNDIVENIDNWLDTGEPADQETSKKLYENAKEALK